MCVAGGSSFRTLYRRHGKNSDLLGRGRGDILIHLKIVVDHVCNSLGIGGRAGSDFGSARAQYRQVKFCIPATPNGFVHLGELVCHSIGNI